MRVKGLKLKNVSLRLAANDQRPAFVCEDGSDIELNGWTLPETSGATSVIRLENVSGALIRHVRAKGTAGDFVQVKSAGSKDIRVLKSGLTKITGH